MLKMPKKAFNEKDNKALNERKNSDSALDDREDSRISHVHLRITESEKNEWEQHLKEQKYPSISRFIRVAVRDLIKKEKANANSTLSEAQREMLDFAKETIQLLKQELLREANSLTMK